MPGRVRTAIIGVGNCASALVQGVHFYRDVSDEASVPGLMHVNFGGYRPGDIEFVAAFDVNERKVGLDLSEAIFQEPNNLRRFCTPPKLNVTVQRGPVLDGVGRYLKPVVRVDRRRRPVSVAQTLEEAKADVVVCYLPVGSEKAVRYYASEALKAGCAFVNAMPVFIASDPEWQKRFEERGLPVAGDDVMSQIGATVLHKSIVRLLADRGVRVEESYQLNIGGDTDFLNMLEEERLQSKRESKTSAVKAMLPYPISLRIGPSDYVEFLENKKVCYIWVKGRYFGDTPVTIDVKLDVQDAPNSAGVMIDALRAAKLALDRGVSGPLTSISSYAFKHPPVQAPYTVAREWVEEFIQGKRER
ncbi:MAG: inositol-3-phosphate synthase [Candidatus Bathyarchaeia archaeon]